MTIAVHPVDPSASREDLLAVIERNLPGFPHRRRFEWLYENNPAGPARSWFVRAGGSTAPVGVASLFPRFMWAGSRVLVCGQVGDFAIDPAYRSLGPAVMLQRATLKPVDDGAMAFCYDCPPDDRVLATFRRLGISPSCELGRYVRLVKADRQVARRLGAGPLASGVAAAGNLALRVLGSRRRTSRGIQIAKLLGAFGDEFSDFDLRHRSGAIRSRRHARDLNWRYREDPLDTYEVLTAREHDELVGFAVFSRSGADTCLLDLRASAARLDVMSELLYGVVDDARRSGSYTVQVVVNVDHGLCAALDRCGFRYRSGAARLVAYARPGTDLRRTVAAPHAWHLNQVDVLS